MALSRSIWIPRKRYRSSNKRHGELHIMKKEKRRRRRKQEKHVRCSFQFSSHSKRSVENGSFLSSIFDWKRTIFFSTRKETEKNVTPSYSTPSERNVSDARQHRIERKNKMFFLIWLVTRSVWLNSLAPNAMNCCCNIVCRYCQLNLIHASILLFHNAHIEFNIESWAHASHWLECKAKQSNTTFIKLASSNSIWYQTEQKAEKHRGTQGKNAPSELKHLTCGERVRVCCYLSARALAIHCTVSIDCLCAWYACTNFFPLRLLLWFLRSEIHTFELVTGYHPIILCRFFLLAFADSFPRLGHMVASAMSCTTSRLQHPMHQQAISCFTARTHSNSLDRTFVYQTALFSALFLLNPLKNSKWGQVK